MKECLKYQQITLRNALVEDEPTIQREEGLGLVLWVFVGILCGIGVLIYVKGCSREPMPAVTKAADCKCCHNRQAQMTAYFKRKGSQSPQEMADAVINHSRRNSRLLAAVAAVESGGNIKPASRYRNGGSGYKGRHFGAYQVNPKYWSAVPTTAIGQTQQAEAILEELTADQKAIVPALNYYGGESNLKHGKYAFNVLNELREVP